MKNKIIFLSIAFLLIPSILFAAHAENTYFSEQEYLYKVNFSQYVTWRLSDGEGTVIAVIDEGVWLQHSDLIGANWINSDEIPNNNKDDDNNGYVDDYYGWNFIDDNHNLVSKGSHGTAVAGIIAARDNTEGIVGIAPKSKIMPLTVCDSDGCYNDKIYEAIIYATDNGAHIINISLGSNNGYIGYNSDLDKAMNYADQHGVIVVAAAGNGDIESSNQTGMDLNFYKISPVNNNHVLGVGALDKSGKYRTYWSNFGAGVDIYAPGEDIISTVVPAYNSGYGYDYLDGTSFSAPIVSGAIALLKSYSTLSNTEIVNRIITQSNKGVLDIRASLEGLDIKYRRDSKLNPLTSESKKTNDTTTSISYTEPAEENNKIDEIKNFISEERKKIKFIDKNLSERLKGKILLQIENHGEAWYVNPKNGKRHYMANGKEAYNIMRDLGVGITNIDLDKIKDNKDFAKKHSGKIFLQIEDLGQAYYIDFNGNAHYLKDGAEAYNIMRDLGLGIKNEDIRKIEIS